MHPSNIELDKNRQVWIHAYDGLGGSGMIHIIPHAILFGNYKGAEEWLLSYTNVKLNLVCQIPMRLIDSWGDAL